MNPRSSELRLFVDAPSPVAIPVDSLSTRWLLSTACSLTAAFVSCLVIAGYQPPLWFQPTLVGALWGYVFLVGFAIGSFGRGSFLAAIVAVASTWLIHTSLLRLTDLPPPDSLMITSLLLSSGWLIARLDRQHLFSGIASAHAQASQWSIADLVFATTMAACFVQSVENCDWTVLLLSAMLAAAGGVVCSWFAYRWVWLDHYSYFSLLVSLLGLILATLYVHHIAPVDATLWESVQWICMGPVNVIASQATTVMFMLALIRFESQSRTGSWL